MGNKGMKFGSPSEETRRKIGAANSGQIYFNCEKCGNLSSDCPSHYNKKKRHFCSSKCYHLFIKEDMPKEEQPRFGSGHTKEERQKRVKARSTLNHYLRDKKIERPPCQVCGDIKSEAHHDDYDKPLEVKWLCFKHHRMYHKNPELLNG